MQNQTTHSQIIADRMNSDAGLQSGATRSSGTDSMRDLYDRAEQYMDQARALAGEGRRAFRQTRLASLDKRNQALLILADMFDRVDVRAEIINENSIDLKNGQAQGLTPALLDRLKLNEVRIESMSTALREIAAMNDPVGEVISGSRLSNGVQMVKRRVPLGVVFTVYESRPNVTIDVGALCLKSGNAAILRGGREALHSNRVLHRFFVSALVQAGLPEHSIQLVQETDRAYMLALLQQDRTIDLVVPRGGEALIQFVAGNSRIPVVKHDKGVCNLFIDADADPDMAAEIAINAKLQRPSVCNAIENILIHADFKSGSELLRRLHAAGAVLSGCERSHALSSNVKKLVDTDLEAAYAAEFLDERLAVRVVDSLEEALDFIDRYGSGHSEAIVSRNINSIHAFQAGVDCAAVFVNCSTRFHDGGQMGMGAEVGISTGRLHVRGPMGIRDLTTTCYTMEGDGQIRS